MKITDMTNLWIAKNVKEDFAIAVVAFDKEEAMDTARGYFSESGMNSMPSNIEITEFNNETNIDCDYVIA